MHSQGFALLWGQKPGWSCQLCVQHRAEQEGWSMWLPADSPQLPWPDIGTLPMTGTAARLGHGHAALTYLHDSQQFSKSSEDPMYPKWISVGVGMSCYITGCLDGQCHRAPGEQTWWPLMVHTLKESEPVLYRRRYGWAMLGISMAQCIVEVYTVAWYFLQKFLCIWKDPLALKVLVWPWWCFAWARC